MSVHAHPKPVGGRLVDRPMVVLLALFGLAAAVMAYRFVFGVGAVSNMTDGFTWGIWEPVNVVVFTGIGAGALGVGLLTYVLNQDEYHGLVRPAVLLGAICYTLGGSSIMVALGRYWNAIVLPVVPFWNLRSALLEVAVCVMAYICVLWVEVLPSILDRAAASASPRWSRIGMTWGWRLARLMPYVIALAVVLPVMHQSSLGGLYLIAGPKLHPLWHTALLPLLFLVSCVSMGYGAVVALVTILKLAWNVEQDQRLFARMSRLNAGILLFYVALRVGDLAWTGKLQHLRADFFGFLFAAELALFLAPAVLFLRPAVQRNRGRTFGAALLAVAAGAVYRVDTYLTVYRPAPGWDYFPSVGELTVTVGMAAVGIAVFIFVCRLFPVVVVAERPRPVVEHGRLGAVAGGSRRSERP
jgi:Ni/Fe-hydrogenase subunit HybB-like protein